MLWFLDMKKSIVYLFLFANIYFSFTPGQMTVVEAYACGKKIDPPDNKSLVSPTVLSLLIEAIAQNTTGSVFLAEVSFKGHCFDLLFKFSSPVLTRKLMKTLRWHVVPVLMSFRP